MFTNSPFCARDCQRLKNPKIRIPVVSVVWRVVWPSAVCFPHLMKEAGGNEDG